MVTLARSSLSAVLVYIPGSTWRSAGELDSLTKDSHWLVLSYFLPSVHAVLSVDVSEASDIPPHGSLCQANAALSIVLKMVVWNIGLLALEHVF